jgi:hypothetical protein
MTVYGYRGQIVHHNDCTWCTHRTNIPYKRKGRKTYSKEQCGLSGNPIPHPFASEGRRFCRAYQQIDCECDECQAQSVTNNTGISINQTVHSIDR